MALAVHLSTEEHLTGLAEWTMPSAGMFMWIKLLAGISDSDEILEELKENKVVVVPGQLHLGSLARYHHRHRHMWDMWLSETKKTREWGTDAVGSLWAVCAKPQFIIMGESFNKYLLTQAV